MAATRSSSPLRRRAVGAWHSPQMRPEKNDAGRRLGAGNRKEQEYKAGGRGGGGLREALCAGNG